MKPCPKNRKLIAWLALDALSIEQARDLRAHLETCNGCRCYFEELSSVAEKLSAAEPATTVQASGTLHRKVLAALAAQGTPSTWASLSSQFRWTLPNVRVALPVAGAIIVIFATWSVFLRSPPAPPPAPSVVQTRPEPSTRRELDPTLFNYQMVANRSPENLDELLNRQGSRNSPSAPIYTALTFERSDIAD